MCQYLGQRDWVQLLSDAECTVMACKTQLWPVPNMRWHSHKGTSLDTQDKTDEVNMRK